MVHHLLQYFRRFFELKKRSTTLTFPNNTHMGEKKKSKNFRNFQIDRRVHIMSVRCRRERPDDFPRVEGLNMRR